jgi:hypothetical protein
MRGARLAELQQRGASMASADVLPTALASIPSSPEPLPVLVSPGNFSVESRDQLSASAIQKILLEGSSRASCLHSSARE